ncbi:hypothetical protein EKO27_g9922 [Xylaria grammica]|uniref:Uncharacterized protein n=1 Tax=Xylaria grammica TaxID=363999 RepID=A0A439CSN2_9PEZI|nr:hypothetical protein F5X98DRAFT_265744 [Xylaria grammica]RWA05179.1 hypothetical protein EKO27_g9922 [Xylaria grammica]GAW19992.1 hypothetical protein ANO14919_094860 [Xylariales sp. No.14919]
MANVEQPQFNNTLGSSSPPLERQRTNSRDYTLTDEWDASKTPPSRFQKRKGSIYATPSSRDGHVERNRDAVEEFHKAHSKRWSISSTKSGNSAAADPASPVQQQRRKSAASGSGNA